MGWWQADAAGNSLIPDGGYVWGDGPADTLDNALDAIDAEFKEAWGRVPTFEELQSGLLFSARIRYDNVEVD